MRSGLRFPIATLLLSLIASNAFAVDPTPEELAKAIQEKRSSVNELAIIQAVAKKLKRRVWLYGPMAGSFAHYVAEDLRQTKESGKSQADYAPVSIFRSTQQFDIVVDGTYEQITKFESALREAMAKIRLLPWNTTYSTPFHVTGLTAENFPGEGTVQNNPSLKRKAGNTYSTAMIEITNKSGESIFADPLEPNKDLPSFIDEAAKKQIHFYPASGNITSEYVAVNSYLTVLETLRQTYRDGLSISGADGEAMQKVIDALPIPNAYSETIVNLTRAIVLEAKDREAALRIVQNTGVLHKAKLLYRGGNANSNPLDFGFTMKPRTVGEGFSKTLREYCKDWNINPSELVLVYDAQDLATYEALTRGAHGIPNPIFSTETGTNFFPKRNAHWVRVARRSTVLAADGGFPVVYTPNLDARLNADFSSVETKTDWDNNTFVGVENSAMLKADGRVHPFLFMQILLRYNLRPRMAGVERFHMDRWIMLNLMTSANFLPGETLTEAQSKVIAKLIGEAGPSGLKLLMLRYGGYEQVRNNPTIAQAVESTILKEKLLPGTDAMLSWFDPSKYKLSNELISWIRQGLLSDSKFEKPLYFNVGDLVYGASYFDTIVGFDSLVEGYELYKKMGLPMDLVNAQFWVDQLADSMDSMNSGKAKAQKEIFRIAEDSGYFKLIPKKTILSGSWWVHHYFGEDYSKLLDLIKKHRPELLQEVIAQLGDNGNSQHALAEYLGRQKPSTVDQKVLKQLFTSHHEIQAYAVVALSKLRGAKDRLDAVNLIVDALHSKAMNYYSSEILPGILINGYFNTPESWGDLELLRRAISTSSGFINHMSLIPLLQLDRKGVLSGFLLTILNEGRSNLHWAVAYSWSKHLLKAANSEILLKLSRTDDGRRGLDSYVKDWRTILKQRRLLQARAKTVEDGKQRKRVEAKKDQKRLK